MAYTPEGRVKKHIKKWMNRIFPKAFGFMPVQTGYGSNGIPDYIYCVPVKITRQMVGQTVGLFVGIEAKTAKGVQSDLQKIAQVEIEGASGYYLMPMGSDDIEDKLGVLRQYADNP